MATRYLWMSSNFLNKVIVSLTVHPHDLEPIARRETTVKRIDKKKSSPHGGTRVLVSFSRPKSPSDADLPTWVVL